MSFTIEDMNTVCAPRYAMELVGGAGGWSNSISWILLIEDNMILKDFTGRDLAVTTGLGFDSEEKLLALVRRLVEVHASGLVVNLGPYIHAIPDTVRRYCDANDLPLLTVPWSTSLYEMIKDLSMRVFLQSAVDAQNAQALIEIIKDPGAAQRHRAGLVPYFDVDGSFQIALIATGDLDVMDTVERQRISYRIQIYLENITHNAHFFYYDSCFVLVVNALPTVELKSILDGFLGKLERRMPGHTVSVGVGSMVTDLSNLALAYRRARAAVDLALHTRQPLLWFDEMGVYRLLSQVQDTRLLAEMGADLLRPLLEHDREHGTAYVDTLYHYLDSGGSVQEVARRTFTHRNTVIYRINNIKKLLDCPLDTARQRLDYLIACLLVQM